MNRILAAEAVLSGCGNVKLQHYRSDISDRNEVDSFLQTWQEITKAGDEAALEELPIALSMAQAADESLLLDMSILTINNKPVAATMGFVHPHGLEIVRCVAIPGQPAGLESVLLGRLLEQSLLLEDESVEVCPACSLAETARSLWATKLLSSYRYSCAPLSHIRSAALLKYHAVTTPRVSQKRISEPLRDADRNPDRQAEITPEKKRAVPVVSGSNRKDTASQTPQLKIFG